MKTYIVGGAVRDELLGLPVKDRDHVVVGATPEQMLARGFRPVGKDFPVFLHPETQEEYALARTERKTAPGYRGFVFHTAPEVTLEDDLVRRDLTINAIARADDGSLTDPFGGRRDLAARVFRHVSDAFLEDPVRILRLARFAARFADFTVAPETMALMRKMVDAGEVDALVAERVWQEISRGLMEDKPSRMLAVLRECGALARILPELDALWGQPATGARIARVVDYAAKRGFALPVRFAALMLGLGQAGRSPVDAACERLKVPTDCRDLAVMAAREQDKVNRAGSLAPDAVVTLFECCDGFRKPERFAQMLAALECAVRGGAPDAPTGQPWPPGPLLLAALGAARAVNAGAVAQSCGDDKARIPAAVHAARVGAVRHAPGIADAAD
ncbi:multifunctional CCA addition/repair protein [Massilia glaciei]|uniref:Multifunctional CCA addition/repair protein n=1 Tax=Massilia glaciei TaxID=1524097 RepID=A0A2U2HHE7_9BURK|nr:multifunctional CCA addition/repair protein [Massilia glaciei]PWF45071.1 multifunctional CCA addition/repair protein [Massilia glaciei]